MTEVAKSKETMVCTDNTRGVANPANTSETSSKRCQSLALPDHPKLKSDKFSFGMAVQPGHES